MGGESRQDDVVRQIDRVRNGSDVGQRSCVQPAKRHELRARHGEIQQSGEAHALQRVARGEAEHVVAVQERCEQHGDTQCGDAVVAHGIGRRDPVEPRIAREPHDATDQNCVDPRVGGHRQMCLRRAVKNEPIAPREDHSAKPRQHADRQTDAPDAQQQRRNRWIKHVVVLFDRKRPDDTDPGRETVEILRDREVVAEVEQRREKSACREGAVDYRSGRQHAGNRNDDEQRRHQSQQTPQVKAAVADRAVACVFDAHQRRDQIPAEHEEQRDAEAAWNEILKTAVRKEHQ